MRRFRMSNNVSVRSDQFSKLIITDAWKLYMGAFKGILNKC